MLTTMVLDNGRLDPREEIEFQMRWKVTRR